MREGQVEQVGSAQDLYERPASRFVADFIGETNLIEVTLEPSRGDLMAVSSRCLNRIPVIAVHGFHPGERGTLSIRPEKIFFLEDPRNADCAASGVVEEIIYMGDITKYYVRLGEEELLIVKQHNREGIRERSRGEKVWMGWSPLNSVVLKP
jgi:ABC-type Fe3+/spermidine/putrescine transport system ATPase subunit